MKLQISLRAALLVMSAVGVLLSVAVTNGPRVAVVIATATGAAAIAIGLLLRKQPFVAWGCLLVVAGLLFAPFATRNSTYWSICRVCGRMAKSTEWQVPMRGTTYMATITIVDTPFSDACKGCGIEPRHRHVWEFSYRESSRRCQSHESPWFTLSSPDIANFIWNVSRFEGSDVARDWVKRILKSRNISCIGSIFFSRHRGYIAEERFSSAKDYYVWRDMNLQAIGEAIDDEQTFRSRK